MSTDFDRMTSRQLQHAYALTAIKNLAAIVEANRSQRPPGAILRERFGDVIGRHYLDQHHKAAVGAIGIGGLQTTPAELSRAFFAEAESASILGRLTSPRTGFYVPAAVSSGAAEFNWVGEALPSPVLPLAFTPDSGLPSCKVSGVVVVSRELMRLSTPAAVEFLFNVLRAKYAGFLDAQIVSPNLAAVADLNPGSLTNGATPVVSSGFDATAQIDDARRLLARFAAHGGRLAQAVVILSSKNAAGLRLGGHKAFADLTSSGGSYMGLPALCSDAVGDTITLVDQAGVLIADESQGDLEIATQADVEMLDSNLVQSGRASTGSNVTSLWQSGLTAIKVTRYINWKLLHPAAVQYISGADYAPAGSPA